MAPGGTAQGFKDEGVLKKFPMKITRDVSKIKILNKFPMFEVKTESNVELKSGRC